MVVGLSRSPATRRSRDAQPPSSRYPPVIHNPTNDHAKSFRLGWPKILNQRAKSSCCIFLQLYISMGSDEETSPLQPTPSGSETMDSANMTSKLGPIITPMIDESARMEPKFEDGSKPPPTIGVTTQSHNTPSPEVERTEGDIKAITVAWVEYDAQHRIRGKPKTLRKWAFPWILCRTWKVNTVHTLQNRQSK